MAEKDEFSSSESSELAAEPDIWTQLVSRTAAMVESKIVQSGTYPSKRLRRDRKILADELQRLADPDYNFETDIDEVYSLAIDVIFRYNPVESDAELHLVIDGLLKPKPTDLG
jgi:hypothetical protein